jgi:hypothetical protein
MLKVWKYIIGDVRAGLLREKQIVNIPAGARIVDFGLQGTNVVLWALVDPRNGKQRHAFFVCFTGDDVPEDVIPCASLLTQNGSIVVHVFTYDESALMLPLTRRVDEIERRMREEARSAAVNIRL